MWKIGRSSVVVPGCAPLPGGLGFIFCCRLYASAESGQIMIGFRLIVLPDSLPFFICNVKTASLLDVFDSQQVLHTVCLIASSSLFMYGSTWFLL